MFKNKKKYEQVKYTLGNFFHIWINVYAISPLDFYNLKT